MSYPENPREKKLVPGESVAWPPGMNPGAWPIVCLKTWSPPVSVVHGRVRNYRWRDESEAGPERFLIPARLVPVRPRWIRPASPADQRVFAVDIVSDPLQYPPRVWKPPVMMFTAGPRNPGDLSGEPGGPWRSSLNPPFHLQDRSVPGRDRGIPARRLACSGSLLANPRFRRLQMEQIGK
jgi:hypothetical protein